MYLRVRLKKRIFANELNNIQIPFTWVSFIVMNICPVTNNRKSVIITNNHVSNKFILVTTPITFRPNVSKSNEFSFLANVIHPSDVITPF